jgi:hypothetical protein
VSKTDQIQLPTVAALSERHKVACDLKQVVDRARILASVKRWADRVIKEPTKLRFVGSAEEIMRAALAALAARAARAAMDARAARDARDAAWDLSWVSSAAIGALERADREEYLNWIDLLDAFEAGAWILFILKDEIVIMERPISVKVDGGRRLHADDGPAFAWVDDIRDCYWHGVYVKQHVITRPEEITLKEIEDERNIEVRRVLIERFGQERYIREAGAKEIHRDEFGILYRKEEPGDDPILMVKVINSTPEPDGSVKEFFLAVHHELRPLPPGDWPDNKKREFLQAQKPQDPTARNAVASTWGMRGEEYAPAIET